MRSRNDVGIVLFLKEPVIKTIFQVIMESCNNTRDAVICIFSVHFPLLARHTRTLPIQHLVESRHRSGT